MMNKTNSITVSALLTTISLALFVVELLIPPFPFCPAAKIGLANIVILFMLSSKPAFKNRNVFMVLIARCVLSALLTGRLMSVIFSLSGGIAATIVMIFFRKLFTERNVICISICGAVFHNFTQLLVAVCIYGTFSAFYYVPSLFLAGVLCGILTGLCVKIINRLGLHKRFLN